MLAGLAASNFISELAPPAAERSLLRDLHEAATGPFVLSRQFLFDRYQRLMPRVRQAQPVTIVEIDEKSLKQVGQWPWPRNRLADLVDAIGRYEPAAIGLDLYMPEPDQTSPGSVSRNLPPGNEALAQALTRLPSHEARLAASLRAAPTVLGAAGFDFKTYSTTAGLRTVPVRVQGGEALPHLRHFPWVLASLPELQAAARGQALLSVGVEDAVVRRMPMVLALGEQIVPSLPMEMLRVATGSPDIGVRVDGGGIRQVEVADLVVPTQSNGEIWLHFARRATAAPRQVSAVDVLSGAAPAEALQQKLVLVGLTGLGLSDMRMTPLREQVPGIEIQAQVLESLFDGRFLHRAPAMRFIELALMLSIGGVIIWLVPEASGRFAMALQRVPRVVTWIVTGLNVVMIGIGYLLFWRTGILFDAAGLFIGLAGVVGGLVTSTLMEIERREREAREAEQHRQQAEALIALQEAAARRVRIQVVAAPAVRRAPQQIFELATLYSPTQDLGASFCDVVMLDANRLWLAVGTVSGGANEAPRFAALAKAVLKFAAEQSTLGAEEALNAAAGDLADKNPEGLRASVLAAVFDTEDGSIELCSAGHEPPWLVRASAEAEPLPLDTAGALGGREPRACRAARARMLSGEILLLSSPALHRVQAAEGAGEFGIERLRATIADSVGQDPAALVVALRDALARYGGTDAIGSLALIAVRRL